MVRVLFNAEAALSYPLTGVGHYVRNLARGMARRSEVNLECFANFRAVDQAAFNETIDVPVQQRRAAQLRRLAGKLPGVRGLRTRLRTSLFHRNFGRRSDLIYHETNHAPLPFDGPVVVTVHDLSVLKFPEMHPPLRVAWFAPRFSAAFNPRNRIIVCSAFIMREIRDTFSFPEDRIDVVPLGAGDEFRPLSVAVASPVLAKFGLTFGQYLLAVGTLEPRKNLERLLRAYLELPPALTSRCPLVLAGPPGWGLEHLTRRLEEMQHSGRVRILGYVPDEARPALYSGATGLAYPSIYEGFGLPCLEAACCGTPVLTSRDSPMADILRETAILVDPFDHDQLRSGLQQLLLDESLRRSALGASATRSGQYSWDNCIEGTLKVYRRSAAEHGLPSATTAMPPDRARRHQGCDDVARSPRTMPMVPSMAG